jgi:hypothetical protein
MLVSRKMLLQRQSKQDIVTLTLHVCKSTLNFWYSEQESSFPTLIHNSYGTEKAVGKGVKKSGIPRKDIFITTKLWNNKHHPDDVESAMQQSLEDLGTDYVDLYLIHWPVAWRRGEDLFPKKDGKFVMENIDIIDVCCVCIPSGSVILTRI